MMLTLTRILLITFVCSGFLPLQAQDNAATQKLYAEARSLAKKNPGRAFTTLQTAMQQSRQQQAWELYTDCILAFNDLELSEEQQYQVFAWQKSALTSIPHTNKLPIAELHFRVAKFYSDNIYKSDSAVYHFTRAQKIRVALLGENSELVAKCYHGLGDIYKYETYDFFEAEKCYEKALSIREHIHSTDTLELVRNYFSLAATNRSQRDYEKALSYGITAITFCQKIKNYRILELTYTMLANVYRDMGQSAQAQEYYNKAIALNRNTGKDPAAMAWHYVGIGQTWKSDSVWDKAIHNFNEALSLYEQVERTKGLAEDDKFLWVYCQALLADTYRMKKDYAMSLKVFRQHLATLKRTQLAQGRELTEAYIGLGDYYRDVHHYDSALYYYQQSLKVSLPAFQFKSDMDNPSEKEIGTDYHLYRMISRKTEVFQKIYEETRNVTYLQAALSGLMLVEKLMSLQRNTLDMDESKWQFLHDHYNVYEQIIKCLFMLKGTLPSDTVNAKAFYYFERSKSRSLNDALTQVQRMGRLSRTDTLLQRQNEIKRALFAAQDKLNDKHAGTSETGDTEVTLRQKIVQLDRDRQYVEKQIEEKYPGYVKARFSYEVPRLKALQQHANKLTVLEYFFGNESVYAIGVSDNEILFKRLGSADSIRSLIAGLLTHFTGEHATLDKTVYHQFTTNAHQLYGKLVAPYETMLRDDARLQIIPDGLISMVPFEVLITQRPAQQQIDYKNVQYLLNKHIISYHYSASLLLSKDDGTMRRPSVLGMAFKGGTKNGEQGLAEIKGAEQELTVLQQQFDDGKFLSGQHVTEMNFKTMSPAYDIIHLAIHGQGDRDNIYASSLFFDPENDSLEDGQLHAYELYALKLKAQLVVLSACESGLGKVYNGEGMLSMASAFNYAGSKNVLMSLWEVDDQVSVALMNDFYKRLIEGETIDESLILAKRDYLLHADELSADPRIWAPLVAYGGMRPVFDQRKSSIILYTTVAALMILLIGMFYWRKKL